jgi:low temperature requirement protein LtrA
VFAATQVTGYMAHDHTGHGVVQGLLLLALLWWTWSAYAWLGNQARVDEGSCGQAWPWPWRRSLSSP